VDTDKCKAEVVDCKDKADALCKKPDTSDAACALADGGDCKGYCGCAYDETKKGCYLTAPAPKTKACKCVKDETNKKCTVLHVDCKTADADSCKTPDLTDESCAQADGGDCTAHCACNAKEASKCIIKTAAIANKACKCILSTDKSKCYAEVAECKDTADAKCKAPDDSKEACALGQGNCDGYA